MKPYPCLPTKTFILDGDPIIYNGKKIYLETNFVD